MADSGIVCSMNAVCNFPYPLFHKILFSLVHNHPFYPKRLWCHPQYTFGNILTHVSSRVTTSSVALDKERLRLSNDWKAHVFKKSIRSVGGHVPRAGCACQNRNGIRADEILAGRSRGMEATPAGCSIQRTNCEPL